MPTVSRHALALFLVILTSPIALTQSPARFVPGNVDLYLEIEDLGRFVAELPESPLVATLRETGLLEEMTADEGFGELTGTVSLLSQFVADRVGLSLRLQPAGPRFLLSARRKEGLTHDGLLEKLAENIPDLEIGASENVAGARTTELGKLGVVAGRGEWMLWSTHPFHLRRALRTEVAESLSETERYRRLQLPRQESSFALCAKPDRIFEDYAEEMRTDDALGIMLFQGLLDDLGKSEVATAWGRLAPWPRLEVRLDRDRTETGWTVANHRNRRWLSPLGGDVAGLRLDRDLSEFWRRRHDVLPESSHQGLAEFTQTMNTFLSGFPFDDIMKHVKPGAQLIAAPQVFSGRDIPDLRLPSFALILDTDLDAALRDRMRVAFQTTIGIINATAAEENRQPLLQLSRQVEGVEVLGTRFLVDPRDGRKATEYNFTPSLAFVDSTLVLSSTLPFAQDLVRRMLDGKTEPAAGDRLLLRGGAIVDALRLNADALAEQMMLEDALDLDEAEHRVDVLLKAVSRITLVDLRHVDDARGSTWSLKIEGTEEPAGR